MDTATVQSLLPTDEDVAEYRRRGWWVSPRIVPDELLDAAIEGSERYYLGEMADGPPIPDNWLPVQPPPEGMRKNDYASLRQPALAALARLPVIAAIGARLAGVAGVRLWHDQLLYKPPAAAGASANVGWHTDRSYWRACSSEEMVTAWVPFHAVPAEQGALMVLDGSHRWQDAGEDRRFNRQDLDVMEDEIASAAPGRRKLVKVPIALERGQVSFHHCRTFHGSGPNLTSSPRRSLAVHLQPLDNRYCGERDADGNHIFHGINALVRWVDGDPDYTDERYCPQLWPVP